MKHAPNIVADAPFSLQSRGLLLGVALEGNAIAFASETAPACFALSTLDEFFEMPALDLLGPDLVHALRNVVTQPSIQVRRHHLGPIELPIGFYDIVVFGCGDLVVVEAKAAPQDAVPSAYDVLKDVQMLTDVARNGSPKETLAWLVRALRAISGYNVVSVCHYGNEGATPIVSTSLQEPSIGIALPSNTPVCVLEDATAGRIKLAVKDGTDVPNLALSSLQMPPIEAIMQLQNLSAQAAAFVQLTARSVPWGSIQLLHKSARCMNPRTEFFLHHVPLILDQYLCDLNA